MTGDSLNGPWTNHSTTQSDSGGKYAFKDLAAGFYRVNFGIKLGYYKTTDDVGSNEAIDSEALSGAFVELEEGQTRDDIDAGYIADPPHEKREFTLPENSPVGTVVGSVGDPTRFDDYSMTSPWFEISSDGVITVTDNSVLDYEALTNMFEIPVVAFSIGSEPNIIIDVCIQLTDINEPPEYDQGTQLQGQVLYPVTLTFADPEGDEIVSVSGNPQHGVLALPSGSTTIDAMWVPYAADFLATPPATGDQFTLTASDGNSSSAETDITISVTGTPNFGRFELGSNPPPMDKETEPGAIGDLAQVANPAAGHGSDSGGLTIPVIDWIGQALAPGTDFYQNQTIPAREAMDRFLANTGMPYDWLLEQMIYHEPQMQQKWKDGLSALISQLESKGFVGTIQLVDVEAHFAGTTGPYVAAVGQYTGWVNAEVTGALVDGKIQYTVTYNYNFWDPYDWNPARGRAPIPSDLSSFENFKNYLVENLPWALANLHLEGFAMQYMATGTATATFSWNRGEAPSVDELYQRHIADLAEFFDPVY